MPSTVLLLRRKSLLTSLESQDQRLANAEDRECLQHLHVTDPSDDKQRIEETKGGLLEDSYRWILDNLRPQTMARG